MNVYDRPVNRFVAGFLGTPAMNFFDGRIETSSGKTSFVIENDSILLSSRLAEVVSMYSDKKLVLGIRPENISLEPYNGQNQNAISANVQIVEPLGDRMDVYFETPAGTRFIANIDPHIKVEAEQSVKIYLDTEKIHLFEPGDTGKNITLAN